MGNTNIYRRRTSSSGYGSQAESLVDWLVGPHRAKSCRDVTLYLGGGPVNSGVPRVVRVAIPDFSARSATMLAALIRNGHVFTGATYTAVGGVPPAFLEAVRRAFRRYFNSISPDLTVRSICRVHARHPGPLIRAKGTRVHLRHMLSHSVTDAVVLARSPNNAAPIISLALGQTELKVGLRDPEGGWVSERFAKDDGYNLPSGGMDSCASFVLHVGRVLDAFLDRYRVERSTIAAVVIAVSSTVSRNHIVPVPNGLTKNLRIPSEIHYLDFLLQEIPKRFGMHAAELYLLNDGDLVAYGPHQISRPSCRTLTLRLATSLCAGIDKASVLGEFGWMVHCVPRNMRHWPSKAQALASRDYLLRSRLSAQAILTLLNGKSADDVLSVSGLSHRKLGLRRLASYISDAASLVEVFAKVSRVFFYGGILPATALESLPDLANQFHKSKFRSEHSVEFCSDLTLFGRRFHHLESAQHLGSKESH